MRAVTTILVATLLGAAWNDFERADDSQTAVAGGARFRYYLATGQAPPPRA